MKLAVANKAAVSLLKDGQIRVQPPAGRQEPRTRSFHYFSSFSLVLVFVCFLFSFFLILSIFFFLKEENKAKEGIRFITCFFLLSTTVLKRNKQTEKLQMNTERNEMKQKEKRKKRVVGIGILQLLDVLSLFFFKIYFHCY